MSGQVPFGGIRGRRGWTKVLVSKRSQKVKEVITVDIATPRGVFHGEFPKTAKVEEVISAVITQMGLDGGDAFDLVFNGQVLQPIQRPLVSFGIEGSVKLELVATGSGV